jgi:dTDP-4-dehydrorhamnose 3,5-epimerase
LNPDFVQCNISFNKSKGTLRGLHLQKPPKAEIKVVRCLSGSIWDVIVDLREDSKTFGKWFSVGLNEYNRTMLYVPEGFAHGFISLTDNAEIFYLVSEFYFPDYERTLRWNDPLHGINWPITPNVISDKDKLVKDWNSQDAINI